jgi:hypothetical protein
MEILVLFTIIFGLGILMLAATMRSSQISRIEGERDDE